MIEAYQAGEMKNSLKHSDITFDKIEKVDASYGIALNGEARRLKLCMSRFVKENSQRILKEVAEHTVYFEVSNLRLLRYRSSQTQMKESCRYPVK